MPNRNIQYAAVSDAKTAGYVILRGTVILTAVLIAVLMMSFPVYAKAPQAISGTMDLRNWDFDSQGDVTLNGQWLFFPNEWLMPDELKARQASKDIPFFIDVPASWKGFRLNGDFLDATGFATYALDLVLPEDTGPVAIHISEIGTAYTLFVDGKNVITMGSPGKSPKMSKPRVESTVVHIVPQNGHVRVLFQVSNFHHRRGGIWEAIRLGRPAVIHSTILNKAVLDLFLFGVILIMGLYNLGIYSFRKKDRAPFFFAMFCFLVSCRILVIDERLIFNLMPFISTPLMYKIEYITFYLGSSMLFGYLYYSYPRDFNGVIYLIFQAVILAFSAIVIFLGMPVFTKTLTAFQMVCMLLILYATYSLLKAFKQKRTGIRTMLIGFGIFSITVVNDILYARDMIHTLNLFHVGMLVFVLCQSYAMARNFGLAYQTIDDQRQDLDVKNKDLARELQRRKDAESLVKYSEDKYRQLTELLPGAVFETDCSGKILFANKAASTSFGWYPSTTTRTCFLKDGISPSDQEMFESVFSRACESRQVCELEFSSRSSDQTPFPAIMFLSRVLNQSGYRTGVRGIAIDLSRQKELEKRLRHSEKIEAIGTLAGGIAHDFNNILSIILGCTELTQMEIKADSSAGENLESIVSASLRARDLVNQILSYSRKDHFKKSAVNIETILASAVKLVRATIPSNIEIREIYPPGIHTVYADATQIHQIVLNFTTNAVYTMKLTGGRLTISVQNVNLEAGTLWSVEELPAGDYICLTFEDTGQGIEKAHIARIFDPFFTTKGPGSGTGMGLSVVQGIVQEHGGAVTVDSHPGKGACFRVYFPAFEEKADSTVLMIPAPVRKGGEHILFVDDEPGIVACSNELLNSMGYQVTAITSSMEALSLIKNRPHDFDLVITDMTMPLMTGSVLASEIRSIRQDLPVIMATGYNDQINKTDAEKIGINAFLMKPVSKADLGNTIRDVLEGAYGKQG